MEFIQEMESLVGDISITKEEQIVLNEFTDEVVGFKHGMGRDYSQSKELASAFRKINEHNKMECYLKLIVSNLNDNIDDFYKKMDEE